MTLPQTVMFPTVRLRESAAKKVVQEVVRKVPEVYETLHYYHTTNVCPRAQTDVKGRLASYLPMKNAPAINAVPVRLDVSILKSARKRICAECADKNFFKLKAAFAAYALLSNMRETNANIAIDTLSKLELLVSVMEESRSKQKAWPVIGVSRRQHRMWFKEEQTRAISYFLESSSAVCNFNTRSTPTEVYLYIPATDAHLLAKLPRSFKHRAFVLRRSSTNAVLIRGNLKYLLSAFKKQDTFPLTLPAFTEISSMQSGELLLTLLDDGFTITDAIKVVAAL